MSSGRGGFGGREGEGGYYDANEGRERGEGSGARLRPRVERFGEADQYGTAVEEGKERRE
jgi:hypothetical protein